MADFDSSVAILLFTRSARQDAARKKLVSSKGHGANVAVVARLIDHAATTAQQAGVDFLLIESARQTGVTFGERLSEAMQKAFASGYERLLVIGNDCPQLDVLLLRRALAALAEGGAVLGPTTDGGVYLLGVAQTHFDASTWAALPWQTATLGQSLAAHLETAGAAVQALPRLADVDNEQDLAQALRLPLSNSLLRVLRWLRRSIVTPLVWHSDRLPQPAFAAAYPHRGPPDH
ncbi:DUF2064 domain-containing protein [Hymenobacter negativus]|uniref:DUF2064 domain-containing protein n=1 Tax=Hymenobacter negativus TaxID=2795026 RepID=A0ABS3QP06_9BACT|nr:DUF2064 domain-containing protein [Hymenobacter negativus]MBO2013020.1 DUF2064 domain-containing protein [Hymenobacter negativus]